VQSSFENAPDSGGNEKVKDPLQVKLSKLADQYSNIKRFQTVYVRLLEEGTEVWRPVRAAHVLGDAYVLSEQTGRIDGDEIWEFPNGSRVNCIRKKLAADRDDLMSLVAISLA
jgi:hypothetical protein